MTRSCGGCTACCSLIPVEEIGKLAGHRCVHQRAFKGCAIYPTRPMSCREWSCLWLKGTEDGGDLGLRRPDRSHYVLDETPDMVRLTDKETGKVTEFTVMQAWCDPRYPMAVEDDAELKAMLERVGIILLVRFNSTRAYTLWPPSRSPDGQWHRTETQNAEDLREAQERHRTEFWLKAFAQQQASS